jgi:tRNA (adenine22-N1)-methyltransferase
MHIDRRLETIANLVPQGCVLADIGTDHAYLPVWLLEKDFPGNCR